jgi:protein-S-isoprenylcysteine O-methyltransferase Ste14
LISSGRFVCDCARLKCRPLGGRRESSMKEKRGEHPFGDIGQLTLVALFLVVWVGDSFFLHWSTFLSDWVPHTVRMTILGLAVLPALILLWTGHPVISGKERPDHVLDTGPFRHVRHPLYLAALLGYVGTAISSLSLFSLALLIPIFVFYNYIASYEEKLLEARFGEAYREYERRTGKWLPRVARRS